MTKAWPSVALRKGGRPGTSCRGNGLFHGSAGRRGAERRDLDRQRKAAKGRHPFDFVGDHDHSRGRRGNDLFAQQRAAAALDQGQIRRDLIGAVDGQIEFRRLVERGQRNAKPLGLRRGSPREVGTAMTSRPPRTRSPAARRNAARSIRCRARAACPDARIPRRGRRRRVFKLRRS